MIPIGDEDSGPPGFPVVNIAIIVLNVLVFLYQLVNPDFTNGYSTVPAEITSGKDLIGSFMVTAPDGSSVQIDEAPGPMPIPSLVGTRRGNPPRPMATTSPLRVLPGVQATALPAITFTHVS